jgi:hypothetical protein
LRKISSGFAFSKILGFILVDLVYWVIDSYCLFLLSKLWIKAKVTSDGKEIRSSIKEHLDWSIIRAHENGSNISGTILIGKVHSESFSTVDFSGILNWVSILVSVASSFRLGLLPGLFLFSVILIKFLLIKSSNANNISNRK